MYKTKKNKKLKKQKLKTMRRPAFMKGVFCDSHSECLCNMYKNTFSNVYKFRMF